MNKKLLVLETSVTLQKLFTTTLDSDNYTVQFVSDGRDAVYQLFDFVPDVFLLNAEYDNPRSFDIVRVVRTIPCFKDLTVGMYATGSFPFDDALAKDCGATSFVRIDQKTMALNIEELAQIPASKLDKLELAQLKKDMDDGKLFLNATTLLKGDSVRNIVLSKILQMVDTLESIETVVTDFLSLVAELCEVPAAALYVVENDGPHGYYVCASGMSEREIGDFLKVCAADFEKEKPDYNISKLVPQKLECRQQIDRFYSKEIQLSSYETGELMSQDERQSFGTVHIISGGNFTREKTDLFRYCIKNSGTLFDKTLVVEKKIFFERRIRKAFSRFVPEQIIDELVTSSDATEKVSVGEKRAVAILFSDIRSFTSISELNRPETMVAFLNRYFTAMVNVIKKHGGTIDKFIGDAIMALFGAPVSYEDNARRAAAAACEMRQVLPSVELGDLILPEGMKFNIGIGIHYGDVTVGSLGSADKTDYTCIGDTVNLASRLEGLTKVYGSMVLVSESVKDDCPEGEFTFRYLDDVRVKGKAKAVPIFAVDRSPDEFPPAYKDAYTKGMELYKQGIWNLGKEYFEKALDAVPGDKAAKLMLGRCEDFIANPPEHWDGAIAFTTK
ncbi:MAG TPA: guanylate cyclase [Treponema sp.]|nr:guanylate cyclase [Treponema sp.]